MAVCNLCGCEVLKPKGPWESDLFHNDQSSQTIKFWQAGYHYNSLVLEASAISFKIVPRV
eukprot:5708842-Amphidinium_carterae.1